jgi:hypothetical protein
MRPFFVVVFALMLHLFLRVCKAHEPVGVSLVEARKSYGLTQRFCWRNATIRDCRYLRRHPALVALRLKREWRMASIQTVDREVACKIGKPAVRRLPSRFLASRQHMIDHGAPVSPHRLPPSGCMRLALLRDDVTQELRVSVPFIQTNSGSIIRKINLGGCDGNPKIIIASGRGLVRRGSPWRPRSRQS